MVSLLIIVGFIASNPVLAGEFIPSIPGKIIFRAIDMVGIKKENTNVKAYIVNSIDSSITINPITPEGFNCKAVITNTKVNKLITFNQNRAMPWNKATLNLFNTYNLLSLKQQQESAISLEQGLLQQALSPDGSQIIFTLEKRKNSILAPLSDIFIQEIESGKTYQLTSTEHNVCPAWSPDGKQIAFYRGDESISCLDEYLLNTKGFALFIMDDNGNHLKEIVSNGYLFDVYRDYPPQWSPSGDEIVFSYKKDPIDELYGGVYIVNKDGSGLKLLKRNGGWYSWSPIGNKIAMTVFYGREGSKIHVMDSTGANEKVLVSGNWFNERLFWSPDGKWIVFVSNRTKNQYTGNLLNTLYIISVDGKNLFHLTPGMQIQTHNAVVWVH
jgi:dipeptidyl aminopeptidase/acylaminoacyl peptidase